MTTLSKSLQTLAVISMLATGSAQACAGMPFLSGASGGTSGSCANPAAKTEACPVQGEQTRQKDSSASKQELVGTMANMAAGGMNIATLVISGIFGGPDQ